MKAIIGIGLSLDLTYRDLQNKLKSEGLPWEKSKGFDGSCPTTNFISPNHFTNLNNIQFKLFINGKERQRGDSSAMIFRIDEILCYASKYFSILPGDLVLTGTPFGVGLGLNPPKYLKDGDVIELGIEGLGISKQTCVAYK